MKHTDGPWTVGNDGAPTVIDADGYTVAGIFSRVDDGAEEANARLIAAAPEMYEALREAKTSLVYAYGIDFELCKNIAAILDTAEGR